MKILIVGPFEDHRRISLMLKAIEQASTLPREILIVDDEPRTAPGLKLAMKEMAKMEIPPLPLPPQGTKEGKRKRGRDWHRMGR